MFVWSGIKNIKKLKIKIVVQYDDNYNDDDSKLVILVITLLMIMKK